MSEHSEQCALIEWANLMSNKHPDLKMLYANANGGKRSEITGALLKAEGVKKGIPDLFLAVPRYERPERMPLKILDSGHLSKNVVAETSIIQVGNHGLFIEMKFGKNKLTKEQKECIADLRAQGYRCEVCYSFEEARDAICDYLGIKE